MLKHITFATDRHTVVATDYEMDNYYRVTIKTGERWLSHIVEMPMEHFFLMLEAVKKGRIDEKRLGDFEYLRKRYFPVGAEAFDFMPK